MNNYTKKILGIVLIFSSIAIGLFFYASKKEIQQPTYVNQSLPDSIIKRPVAEWKTYTNRPFLYEVKYPPNIVVHTIDLYGEISDTKEVLFSGDKGSFVVQVERPLFHRDYALEKNSLNRAQTKERYETLSLGIEAFSKKIWQEQIDDKNPNIRNKKVGELQKTTIQGREAYKFTLTKTFSGLFGGEALWPNLYQFIITESPSGDKFIMRYPVGDQVSESILETFKFTN